MFFGTSLVAGLLLGVVDRRVKAMGIFVSFENIHGKSLLTPRDKSLYCFLE